VGKIAEQKAGESEEAAAMRQRRARGVWEAAKKSGMDQPTFGLWISHVLGEQKPSKDWTAPDLDKLEAGLPEEVRPKRKPGQGPAPSPADVPY
jgi:hypothetical protein